MKWAYFVIGFLPIAWILSFNPYNSIDLQMVHNELTLEDSMEKSTWDNTWCDASIMRQNAIDTIVIHHTATDANRDFKTTLEWINAYHYNHWLKWTTLYWVKIEEAKWIWEYPFIMYHAIISKWWQVNYNRDMLQIWWGTKLCKNNWNTYHIALVWNFNIDNPTKDQIVTLDNVIKEVKDKYPKARVTFHRSLQWEQTACPGKNFPYDKYAEKEDWLSFLLTRYYSPTKDQTKYLSWEVNLLKKQLWREPTLEELYEASYKRQFGNDPDITMPSDWKRYTNDDAWLVAACPPERKLWTKFIIKWYNNIITCRDRWSAIKNKRLDLFAWIWNHAIEIWNTLPTWKVTVKFVE